MLEPAMQKETRHNGREKMMLAVIFDLGMTGTEPQSSAVSAKNGT